MLALEGVSKSKTSKITSNTQLPQFIPQTQGGSIENISEMPFIEYLRTDFLVKMALLFATIGQQKHMFNFTKVVSQEFLVADPDAQKFQSVPNTALLLHSPGINHCNPSQQEIPLEL